MHFITFSRCIEWTLDETIQTHILVTLSLLGDFHNCNIAYGHQKPSSFTTASDDSKYSKSELLGTSDSKKLTQTSQKRNLSHVQSTCSSKTPRTQLPSWGRRQRRSLINAPRQGSALPLTACQISPNVVPTLCLAQAGKKKVEFFFFRVWPSHLNAMP